MVFVLSFIGSKTLLIMLCSDQNEIIYLVMLVKIPQVLYALPDLFIIC